MKKFQENARISIILFWFTSFFIPRTLFAQCDPIFGLEAKEKTQSQLGIDEYNYCDLEAAIDSHMRKIQGLFSKIASESLRDPGKKEVLKASIIDLFESPESTVEIIRSPRNPQPIGSSIKSYLNNLHRVSVERRSRGIYTFLDWLSNEDGSRILKANGPAEINNGECFDNGMCLDYKFRFTVIQTFRLAMKNALGDFERNGERYVFDGCRSIGEKCYGDATEKVFDVVLSSRRDDNGLWKIKVRKIWALQIISFDRLEDCQREFGIDNCTQIRDLLP